MPGNALEIDAGAEREHQLVIFELDGGEPRALHDDRGLLLEVDAHDLRLAHLNLAQELAQRHHRVGGVDADGGDLGQQGLEDEIVVVVDELDVELAAAELLQRLRGEHAAEAAAKHEDLLLVLP